MATRKLSLKVIMSDNFERDLEQKIEEMRSDGMSDGQIYKYVKKSIIIERCDWDKSRIIMAVA